MSALARRLWPRSLAARLALLLLLALAAAQLALVGVLRWREDGVVEAIGHGKALNATVLLARALTVLPAADAQTLVAAYDSRTTCAALSNDPPSPHAASDTEERLGRMFKPMLHGLPVGEPVATIDSLGAHAGACADAGPFARDHAGDGDKPTTADPDAGLPIYTTLAMSVPFADGRWLTTRTEVETPGGLNRVTLISFLVSSLAAASVAALAVRSQTRSLRALADASERFGRGESVAPLPTRGPSEVAAAATAFNTMQGRLGEFLRDRLRLLAGISHDLRTPLTTLRLKAEFVDDSSVRDGLVASIDELTTICEATLAFSRAEATAEPTRTLDLAALAANVAGELSAAGLDVAAAPARPLAYPCRPVALKRALRNLAENAARYGERARLSVERRADAAVISVDDDGPGLPPDRIEDAFKPFVRLEESRSVETGGHGLGLAIARSIAQAHGGTLTLTNRAGGGLRAEIALPLGVGS